MKEYKNLKENIQPRLEWIQLPPLTKLSKILSDIDKIKSRKKIDVIVVDYLQAIGFETNHPTRPDIDLANVSKRLQAYGRINKLVTITALQLKNKSTKEIRGRSKKISTDSDANKVEINTEDLGGSQMIIADADNALGIVKDERDKPPTKVFITITKARDSESGRVVPLDFDGAIGRICDPEFESGQIREIDNVIYNNEITEEEIESSDDLFSENNSNNEEKKVAEENKESTVENSLEDIDDIIEEKPKPKNELHDESIEIETDEDDIDKQILGID